jgi:4-amino-4-deoxy-L-arabinose transferase-like glycosyltransferase
LSPGSTPIPHPTPDAEPSAPRTGTISALSARDRMVAAALVLGALAARLFFVLRLPRVLQWADAREYEAMGRQILTRHTFDFWTQRPPGYPYFIAGVYQLFGPNLLALRIVEAVLSTLAVGLVGFLGFRLFGRRAAVVALALAAFHPLLAFMPSTQYTENLCFVLVVLILVSGHAAIERGGWWRWAITGVLLGAAALVRPNAIAFLPGFGLGAALLLHRARRSWVLPAVLTVLAFTVTIAPWMASRHQVSHRWYFISTGGGRQLWLGNNQWAICDTRVTPVVPDSVLASMVAAGDNIDQDRWYMREAKRFMREHPGRALQLYGRKLANIFALYPQTSTGIYENPASLIAQGLASLVIFAGVLLALARLRDRPGLWPMLLGSLSFVLATALAFSSMRYRLFVEPCLILGAAVGWTEFGARRVTVPTSSRGAAARIAS